MVNTKTIFGKTLLVILLMFIIIYGDFYAGFSARAAVFRDNIFYNTTGSVNTCNGDYCVEKIGDTVHVKQLVQSSQFLASLNHVQTVRSGVLFIPRVFENVKITLDSIGYAGDYLHSRDTEKIPATRKLYAKGFTQKIGVSVEKKGDIFTSNCETLERSAHGIASADIAAAEEYLETLKAARAGDEYNDFGKYFMGLRENILNQYCPKNSPSLLEQGFLGESSMEYYTVQEQKTRDYSKPGVNAKHYQAVSLGSFVPGAVFNYYVEANIKVTSEDMVLPLAVIGPAWKCSSEGSGGSYDEGCQSLNDFPALAFPVLPDYTNPATTARLLKARTVNGVAWPGIKPTIEAGLSRIGPDEATGSIVYDSMPDLVKLQNQKNGHVEIYKAPCFGKAACSKLNNPDFLDKYLEVTGKAFQWDTHPELADKPAQNELKKQWVETRLPVKTENSTLTVAELLHPGDIRESDLFQALFPDSAAARYASIYRLSKNPGSGYYLTRPDEDGRDMGLIHITLCKHETPPPPTPGTPPGTPPPPPYVPPTPGTPPPPTPGTPPGTPPPPPYVPPTPGTPPPPTPGTPPSTPPAPKLKVRTEAQALEGKLVGKPIHDLLIVEGTVPEGAYATVDLFYNQSGEMKTCGKPVWTSEKLKVPPFTPATLKTGEFKTRISGQYHFQETVYDGEGKILAQGDCGADSETLVITPDYPPVASNENKGLATTGMNPYVGSLSLVLLAAGGVTIWRVSKIKTRHPKHRKED